MLTLRADMTLQGSAAPRAEALPMAQPEAHSTEGGLASSWGKSGLAAGLIGLCAVAAMATGMLPVGTTTSNEATRPAIQQTVEAPQAAPSLLTPVAAADTALAIDNMLMSDGDKQSVRTAVKDNKLQLSWITVSDFDHDDADWVTLSAAGFKQDIRLFKKPITIAIPHVTGMPVTVKGLIDGHNGGVTVAVHINGSLVGLRPLQPGQSLEVATR